MERFSIKGIFIAICMAIILSIPTNIMYGYSLVYIYNDSVNSSSQIIYHPLFIAYLILSIVIVIGIPSYISASIAKKSFVLNSVAFSLVMLSFGVFQFNFLISNPFYSLFIAIFTLSVGYVSGVIRLKQQM